MIDQVTNRFRMDIKFSTMALAPQDFVSYIIDFENKHLYFKQNDSCLLIDIDL